jgi:hypothetical protein
MAKKTPAPRTELPINEPLPDWMPLWSAPFFCLSRGVVHTWETWTEAFCEEARHLTTMLHRGRQIDPRLIARVFEWPKWSIRAERWSVRLDAMEIATEVFPGNVYVFPTTGVRYAWSLSNQETDILSSPKWDRHIYGSDRDAAFFHKVLLGDLLPRLTTNFAYAVESGALRIMARPRSVLAPFERIAWDQWQFFALENEAIEEVKQFDWRPHLLVRTDLPSTAVTLNGERIYSIHVAPGDPASQSAEEKCLRQLRLFIWNNPERCPIPVDKLIDEMTLECPEMTKKAIRYCVFRAIEETGQNEWVRRGRFKKISQRIPLK